MFLSVRKHHSGFTIVELLIVIVVIAILAAVAVVAYNGITNHAREASLQSDLSTYARKIESYKSLNGEYPASLLGADLSEPPGVSVDYVVSATSYCLSFQKDTLKYKISTAFGATQVGTCRNQGVVSLVAGSGTSGYVDGSRSEAQFASPFGLARDAAGNMYVADTGNNRIRKIASSGQVETVAGSGAAGTANGAALSAQFNMPQGVAVDSHGNIFVADTYNHIIRKISTEGVVSTFAGSGNYTNFFDGQGTNATFFYPYDIIIDASDNLYVSDTSNNRIRKITPSGMVSTYAGGGVGSASADFADGAAQTVARFNNPHGLARDAAGNIYVADTKNSRIRKISADGTTVSTVAGSGEAGVVDGIGVAAQLNRPWAIAVASDGTIYFGDGGGLGSYIRTMSPSGQVRLFAGAVGTYGSYADGTGTDARFYGVNSIQVDSLGVIYVSDTYNNRIRKIE